jgi:hypothetical protein
MRWRKSIDFLHLSLASVSRSGCEIEEKDID